MSFGNLFHLNQEKAFFPDSNLRSLHFAEKSYHNALYVQLVKRIHIDWLHRGIGRLQPEALLFLEKPLQSGAAVLQQSNHNFALIGGGFWFDYYKVAVVNPVLYH